MQGVFERAVELGLQAIGAIAILIMGHLLARLVRRWMVRTELALSWQRFLAQLVCVGVLVFSLLATLSQFGIETASFIAGLGAGGVRTSRGAFEPRSQRSAVGSPAA